MFIVKLVSTPVNPTSSDIYTQHCRIVGGLLTSFSCVGDMHSTTLDTSLTVRNSTSATEVTPSGMKENLAAEQETSPPSSSNIQHSETNTSDLNTALDLSPFVVSVVDTITETKVPSVAMGTVTVSNDSESMIMPCSVSVSKDVASVTSSQADDFMASVRKEGAWPRVSCDRRVSANRRERERIRNLTEAFNALEYALPHTVSR